MTTEYNKVRDSIIGDRCLNQVTLEEANTMFIRLYKDEADGKPAPDYAELVQWVRTGPSVTQRMQRLVARHPERTDRETLIDMFERAGVVWRTEDKLASNLGAITVEAKEGPANQGYTGFFAEFDFSEDGALARIILGE